MRKVLSGEAHHIFSQFWNKGEREGKIKRLFHGRAGWANCVTIWQRLQMYTALQLFFAVWFPKADREYGQSQDLEKITRFIRTSMYFLFSVSLPLSFLLTPSHTHNSVQPKHPWGRASGCWKCQTALPRPISVRGPNHCVESRHVCMFCRGKKKTPNPKAKCSIGLSFQLDLDGYHVLYSHVWCNDWHVVFVVFYNNKIL